MRTESSQVEGGQTSNSFQRLAQFLGPVTCGTWVCSFARTPLPSNLKSLTCRCVQFKTQIDWALHHYTTAPTFHPKSSRCCLSILLSKMCHVNFFYTSIHPSSLNPSTPRGAGCTSVPSSCDGSAAGTAPRRCIARWASSVAWELLRLCHCVMKGIYSTVYRINLYIK